MAVGGSWTKNNQLTEAMEYLWLRQQHINTMSQSWEMYEKTVGNEKQDRVQNKGSAAAAEGEALATPLKEAAGSSSTSSTPPTPCTGENPTEPK